MNVVTMLIARPWRRPISAAVLVGCAVIGLPHARGDAAATQGIVPFRSGEVVTVKQAPAELSGTLAMATRGAARHVVVQFDRPVTDVERQQLEAAGIDLLSYLGDNAFFATVAANRANPAAAANLASLRCVLPVQTTWKLHPDFIAGQIPEWSIVAKPKAPATDKPDEPAAPPEPTIVAAYVVFHGDVPAATEGVRLCQLYGANVRSVLDLVNTLVVELPADNVALLAAEDVVSWIEPPLPKFAELNDSNRARTGANLVQAAPYGLDGSGVTVMVYDGGTGRATHQDFGGRLHVRDSSGMASHSTHVAGTIGGSGVASSGLRKGMAPAVILESYGFEQAGGLQQGFLYTDPGDLAADYKQAISTYGADIANNSIGTNTAPNGYPCTWEGNYGVTDTVIDKIVRGDGSDPNFTQPFRIVWANGNERQVSTCLGIEGFASPYHSTAPPACAKNHITVGALNSNDDSVTDFTSFGPADDGRLKPDLSGPGCEVGSDSGVTSCDSSSDTAYTSKCGTSMAAPTVCGLSALLLQDFRQQYPTLPDFRNSTLKVLLAHTAVDLENPGPDYKTGYGSVRIKPAVDLERSGNFIQNQVTQGQTYQLFVIVATGDTQLKVTLAWDDVPGTPNVNPALVNDLDLRVYNSTNQQFYPWTLSPTNPSANAVRTQADHLNNIEQVVIDNPPPGAYRVEVVGYNVPSGPQPFSLAATPYLVNCSSAGIAVLDRPKYACDGTAALRVVDCDLNTSNTVVDTVTVTLSSTSEPAGETVVLTETAAESAAFLGTLALSTTDAPGVLLVAPGDTVTLTYNDADHGDGQPAAVTTTAVVDCAAPTASNVLVNPINPRDATITLTTNEPAQVTVRYGRACDSLTSTQAGSGYRTAHTIQLTGLTDNTPYFYALDLVDEAGNAATDDHGGACWQFSTPEIPDYFTQLFTTNNDLDNRTLSFAPNGSVDFYAGCAYTISALPTDPNGGTTLTFNSGDDGYSLVTLTGGARVYLYGVSYTSFYVGTNGYVTFGSSDTAYNESLANHFNKPRVAACFNDLDVGQGGSVTFRQLADRAVVTWLNVPVHNSTSSRVTMQIELYFDGRLTINYLTVGPNDGLAGLSAGTGVPADYFETDLSAMNACGPRPPSAGALQTSTAQSRPTTLTLPATDDGLPNPPGMLTYTLQTLPTHGTLADPGGGPITAAPYTILNNNDRVDYAPEPNYRGTDTFSFRVNDGGTAPAGGDSNVATVTITVGGPDWDPNASNVTATTAMTHPVDITLLATDPQNDPLTYTVESLPARGLLRTAANTLITTAPYTLPGGSNVVRYQPPAGQNLAATFTFSAADATAKSNVATVTVTVGGAQLIYSFPLDTNPGWTTQSLWAWGTPSGGAGDHGGADPNSGHTGRNVYGYNLTGGYTNSMTEQHLTTTAIDCTNLTQVHLKFWRWLGVESASYDHAYVRVSNNNTTWTTVWSNPTTTIDDRAWSQQDYDISAVANNKPTVYIRWTMGATDGSWTYCGWNLDDIEIWGLAPGGPSGCLGDANCDGQISWRDIDFLVAGMNDNQSSWQALFPAPGPGCPFTNLDVNLDGTVTWRDIDPFIAYMNSPCPP